MTLRTRITLATALAMAVVALISSVAIWSALRSELRGEVEQQLVSTSRMAPPRRNDFDDIDDFQAPQQRFGGAAGVRQIVTESGSISRRGPNSPSRIELPVDDDEMRIARTGSGTNVRDVTVDGQRLLMFTSPLDGDGAIQVARPLAEVDRVLDRAAVTLAVIGGLGVLLAAALGRLVGGFVVRPVERFTAETEEIAAGHGSAGRRRLDASGHDEVSRLAASFNETLDALESSVEAQQRLIADAGHELRTPIASVRANIQVLEDADRLPPEELVALRSDIVTELDELTELLSDVIELARGADPDAPHDEVRLDAILRDAAKRAERRGTSAVQFEVDAAAEFVIGDGARIARAVANVVDNARKWSPEGGVVHLSLQDGVIRVRDHGPGIPEGDLPFVFERFHRAATARSMPGSGLGLAIVWQTTQAHGGTATIANAEGGGTLVELSFGPAWTVAETVPTQD